MNFFTQTYQYVPPCPRCKSKKTGYYIYVFTFRNTQKEYIKHLENGELVQFIVGFHELDDPNAYCADCGTRWVANIEERPKTMESMKEEYKNRGISLKEIKNLKNQKQILKERKRKEKAQ